MSDRKLLWKGNPSQAINFIVYFRNLAIVIAIIILAPKAVVYLPVPISEHITWRNIFLLSGAFFAHSFWKYLVVRSHKYLIYTDEIIVQTGVFSPHLEPVEMFRIKDHKPFFPFFLRILGLGSIQIITSDKSTPIVNISAVPNVRELAQSLRTAVNQARIEHGVREFD